MRQVKQLLITTFFTIIVLSISKVNAQVTVKGTDVSEVIEHISQTISQDQWPRLLIALNITSPYSAPNFSDRSPILRDFFNLSFRKLTAPRISELGNVIIPKSLLLSPKTLDFLSVIGAPENNIESFFSYTFFSDKQDNYLKIPRDSNGNFKQLSLADQSELDSILTSRDWTWKYLYYDFSLKSLIVTTVKTIKSKFAEEIAEEFIQSFTEQIIDFLEQDWKEEVNKKSFFTKFYSCNDISNIE